MRKYIIPLAFIFQFALAQQAEVTNVTVAQRTDGSGIVDITYDLTEDAIFTEFDISVEVSFDDGATYTGISQVTGDVGINIMPGTGKTITWDAGSEVGDTFDEDAAVVITATGHTVLSELPFEMVTVPAGEYTYGEGDTVLTIDYDYEIMKYEVSNADWFIYLMEAYPEGNPPHSHGWGIQWDGSTWVVQEGIGNHPVRYINLTSARAFADYYGMRIPTVHEWEKAARGNTGWNYPWGNGITDSYANYNDSGDPWDSGTPEYQNDDQTTPVGFYNGQNYEGYQTSDAPSPYGAYDMAGNVQEWTENVCGYGGGEDNQDVEYCLKGGSYHENPEGLCSYLVDEWVDEGVYWLGFRLVRTINR